MSSTFIGDPCDRAFERLYETYLREVYRYVLAIVRNPAEAEDITQATFLNAYRALRAGAKPRAPHNWLIAIAHNTCRSSVRRAMRRPQEVPLGEAALAVADRERPNVRALLRALRRLPSNQRSALTMRELEGLSYPEIATELGVTVPAVEALLARARRTLRTQAGTLRGLAALLLPRSAGSLGAGAEVAGGGLGGGALGGVLAKAAAMVLVGVAGFASADPGALRRASAPQPAAARPAIAAATSSRPAPATSTHGRSPARPSKTLRRANATPARKAGSPAGRPVVPAAPVAAAPAGAPPGAAAAPAVSGTAPAVETTAPDLAATVEQTAEDAVATVAASLPEAPAPAAPALDTSGLPAVPAPALPVEPPTLPTTPPTLP